jgi:ribose 5-phosphate isomerase B
MKIVIANDHAAVELKKEIQDYIESMGHQVVNIGTDSHASCHYPEYGKKAAEMVASGEVDLGVLICGTGVGISLAANKVKGIRCGVCSDTTTAHLIREHNNANMIAFGARIVGAELAKDIVKSFLEAKFEGGGRHQIRIDMISAIENEK